MAERGAERGPVPGDDAVDRVEAGHLRRRQQHDVEPADRRGHDLELAEQDEDQEQRPPEIGHRTGEHAVGGGEPVDEGAGPQRG